MHRIVWHDMEKPLREHVSFLETLEEGLYDSGGRLREESLDRRG